MEEKVKAAKRVKNSSFLCTKDDKRLLKIPV